MSQYIRNDSYKKRNNFFSFFLENKYFKRTIIVLAALLFLQLFFSFVIVYYFRIKYIKISCECIFDKQEILKFSELKSDDLFFFVDSTKVKQKIERHPLVKKAVVKKVFPNTLNVNIVSREGVAISFYEVNGEKIPILLDEDAVVFQTGFFIGKYNLPVISGVKFVNLRLGMQANSLLDIMSDLAKIKKENKELFDRISELEAKVLNNGNDSYVLGNFKNLKGDMFDRNTSLNMEFLVYIRNEIAPVRIGNALNSTMLMYIIEGLNIIKGKENIKCVYDIDFRTKEMVYKKEPGCG